MSASCPYCRRKALKTCYVANCRQFVAVIVVFEWTNPSETLNASLEVFLMMKLCKLGSFTLNKAAIMTRLARARLTGDIGSLASAHGRKSEAHTRLELASLAS